MVQPGEQWWPVTVHLGFLVRFLKIDGSNSLSRCLKFCFRVRCGKIPSRHTSNRFKQNQKNTWLRSGETSSSQQWAGFSMFFFSPGLGYRPTRSDPTLWASCVQSTVRVKSWIDGWWHLIYAWWNWDIIPNMTNMKLVPEFAQHSALNPRNQSYINAEPMSPIL